MRDFDSALPNVMLDENGLPLGINPDGLLGGLDLRVDPDASANAWANGTHILSPQGGDGIDISAPPSPGTQYTPDFQTVHLPDAVPTPISAGSPANMTASDSAIGFIKSWEKGPGGAAVLRQYSSPEGGSDTVGWGHKIQPSENFSGGLTPAQANQQFSDDLASHQKLVQDNVTAPLSQQQFDALTSLAYDLPSKLKPGSDLLGMLNNYDYSGAASQLFGLNHAGGKVSPGLTARRGDEWNMFTNGVYTNHK